MNKKILFVALVVAVLLLGYLFLGGVSGVSSKGIISRLSDSLVRVPEIGTEVTLKDGKGEFEVAPGSASKGIITLSDMAASYKNGTSDRALSVVTVSSGGTGTFSYLVLFKDEGGKFVQVAEALLGDRIMVQGLELSPREGADQEVVVRFLDRAEGEPMTAEPKIEKTLSFVVKNDLFERK